MFSFRVIFFCIVIQGYSAWAQEPFRLSFKHLNRENGLANNNVFYMHRDSRGYLWLGGLGGLSRYDGKNILNWDVSNSALTGQTIQNITEDKQGNLWIGTDRGLNQYHRQSGKLLKINLPDKQSHLVFVHTIDHNNILWLLINGELHYFKIANNQWVNLKVVGANQMSYKQNRNYLEVRTIWLGNKDEKGLLKVDIDNYKVTHTASYFDSNKEFLVQNNKEYLYAEGDSLLWISGSNQQLAKYDFKKNILKTFKIPRPILLTQIEKYKQYLFLASGNGLWIFDTLQEKFIQEIYNDPTKTNSLSVNYHEAIYKDRFDNLYLGFGVDYSNLGKNLAEHWLEKSYTATKGINSNHITHFKENQGYIFAQIFNGPTIVIDSKGKIIDKLEGYSVVCNDSLGHTWLSGGKDFIRYHPITKSKKHVYIKELDGAKGWQSNGCLLPNNKILHANGAGLYIIDCSDFSYKKILANQTKNLWPIMPIHHNCSSNTIYFSSNWWSKFYELKQDNKGNWVLLNEIKLDQTTMAIRPAQHAGNLWLGTTKGLGYFNIKNKKLWLKTTKQGLPDNAVTDIVELPSGDYWLVTNKGISYYDKPKNRYQSFDFQDGAYSHEYDWGVALVNNTGKFITAGTDGFTLLDRPITVATQKPYIEITQLLINEKPVGTPVQISEANFLELKSNQNTFALGLSGIDATLSDPIQLQYQLSDYDKQWVTTQNYQTIRYVNVPAGNYTFIVKAINEKTGATSITKKINIIIHAPFYKTSWFKSLLMASLMGLSFVLYRMRISQIQAETQQKEELRLIKLKAEVDALRSQMNPHFIFNCLNTVDAYILTNKTLEASSFLNKFSKLVRMILENSRQEFVTLDQDLKALQLYIQLERERSHPQFQFEINIEPDIKYLEYFIPSTLIQPYVENAILHGLRHKKTDVGELLLNIKQMKDQLIIHIIDNGIGRQASKQINELNKMGKNSLGMTLSAERINKLNIIFPEKASLKITDLTTQNDTGTIVELKLPIITLDNLPDYDKSNNN